MKAAAWHSTKGGIDKNLKATTTHPLPKSATSLPKDSTLVRVAYASLNPADYKIPELPLLGRLAFSSGVPGMDFAGTVVSSTSPHFKPGERVFGTLPPPYGGALGEYVVVGGNDRCLLVPEGVDLRDAATLGVAGLTALQTIAPFVEKSGGSKVFINGGSGGVGSYQIQLAKILGCYVTASCSGTNVEFCKSLGADEVIDYKTEDIVQALTRKGNAFDLIVDNVFNNGAALYWASAKYLKPAGTYVSIAGNASIETTRTFLSIMFWPKWLGGGERKFKFVVTDANHKEFAQLAAWMAEGKLKACIEREFELENAAEAFTRLKAGRTRGKLVVKVT